MRADRFPMPMRFFIHSTSTDKQRASKNTTYFFLSLFLSGPGSGGKYTVPLCVIGGPNELMTHVTHVPAEIFVRSIDHKL